MKPLKKRSEVKKLKNRIVVFIPFSIFIIYFILCSCERTSAPNEALNYAADRALIEDLQARYMFALDFGDLDKYVATFTEDGILDIGMGEWRGRDTIRQILSNIPPQEEIPAENDSLLQHHATGRHNITNIVLKIDGDTAYGRAYWFHLSNNNPKRKATTDSYGHYEDIIVRTNGQWLFSKRKIYNEEIMQWAALKENPCW
jgi:hypothetical protein